MLSLQEIVTKEIIKETSKDVYGNMQRTKPYYDHYEKNIYGTGIIWEEGNMFLEILRANPDIQCFILNTGVVGGMVSGQKITVKDSVKIVEMIARDKIKWEKDPYWGYEVASEVPGVELERFTLKNFYSDEQIQELSGNLKTERLNWLSQFPGLDSDILNALKP